MNILFFVLFGLTAAVHVFAVQCEKYMIRVISKMCVMPIVILFYGFNSDCFSAALMLAMIFSWCGDMFLVSRKRIWLYAGIISFLAAHIMYIFVFNTLITKLNSFIFVFSLLLILIIEYFLIKKLNIPNIYKFLIIIYGIIVGFLLVFSVQVFIHYKNEGGVFLAAGSLLFFISDALLAYFNTAKPMTKNALTSVMITYIAAQACIIFGLIIIR
jgi:uncharacterized membrane protein YhhN